MDSITLETSKAGEPFKLAGEIKVHEGGSVFLCYLKNAVAVVTTVALGVLKFGLPDLQVRITEGGKFRIDPSSSVRYAALDLDETGKAQYPNGCFVPALHPAGHRDAGKIIRDLNYWPASAPTREAIGGLVISIPEIAGRVAQGMQLHITRKREIAAAAGATAPGFTPSAGQHPVSPADVLAAAQAELDAMVANG